MGKQERVGPETGEHQPDKRKKKNKKRKQHTEIRVRLSLKSRLDGVKTLEKC